MKSVSIKDIAESLKVSKTLVSLVLNHKGSAYNINPNTQKKVFEKAKELNYIPNRMAQNLRLGKSKNIGLVIPDISNPFYAKIARYIGDFVDEKGYNLLIFNTDEEELKERKIFEIIKSQSIDGVFLISTSVNPKDVEKLNALGVPFVLIDRDLSESKLNFVGIENAKGAFDAIELLIEKGAKRIGYVNIGPNNISSLEERKQGYLSALDKNNIPYKKEYDVLVSFDNLKEDLDRKMAELLSLPEPPDALFLANNKIAIQTLIFLKKRNLTIPNDILIASFDNVDFFDVLNFPIITVAQPIDDICLTASKILFDEISAKDKSEEFTKEKVFLSTKIIDRIKTSEEFNYI